MALYNPDCPYCDIEIDFEEHTDVEDEGGEIICRATGQCSQCKRFFMWDDIYVLKTFINLEEL